MSWKLGKIFIICPRVWTGGPENLHQLCDQLNALGADTYIVYHPNPDNDYSPHYRNFQHLKVAERVEDAPGNMLIIPEIHRIPDARQHFPNCTIVVWWLSYVNAVLCGTAAENLRAESDAIHLFHSYYEYAMVRPHLSWSTSWFFVTDHIHDVFLSLDTDSFVAGKEDIVCFNGNKDKISQHICEKAGIPYIAIKGMTRDEVNVTLQKCKVYLDNGYHPGKDHLPREAAMNGCVVITNKSGSAAYFEDVPIEEKAVLESDLYDLLPKVLADYRHYFDRQSPYRENIRREKAAFAHNVENFWQQINGG
jgi:hypothetical protein